jgi:hypothetical protein
MMMVLLALAQPDANAVAARSDFQNTGGADLWPLLADSNESRGKKPSKGDWWGMADWPREKKAMALNAATLGTLAIIGVAKWDYCSTAFHFEDEGWFDRDTPDGGADKLGHAFLGYTLTGAFSYAYRRWGYSEDQAFVRGAINSLMITTMIEIGDGFSRSQGFCWQDEVMDVAGIGIAYLRYRVPGIREKVDFRIEWAPSASFHKKWDPFTDYSGQKNVLAFKPSGFFNTEEPLWKAIEFQIGYYTRGYQDRHKASFDGGKRYGYVAIGLNMTYLIERLTGHTSWGLFEYYQVPYTYLPATERFD